jgi:hypothetical protein
MYLDLSTYLPCKPEQVISHAATTRLFQYVAAPLIKMRPTDPKELPEVWSEGTYWVSMYLFGFIPFGKQAMVVSFPEQNGAFCLHDNGHGTLINKWDHVITIEESGDGTLYRDRLTVEAGILTPVVWGFAQIFFRHRQRRWRKLVARSFNFPVA